MAVSLTTMYAPQNNGPHTALAEAINAAQTDITVVDASVLPDAPNLLTIGTGEDAELVLMSAKTGNILTVTRGYNGTVAKSWEADEWVYRAITAQDVSALQANVNAINAEKASLPVSDTPPEDSEFWVDTGVSPTMLRRWRGADVPTGREYQQTINADTGSASLSIDNAQGQLRSVALEMGCVAKQAGSGDPSPSNIRAITGRESVDVRACGKNLATTQPVIVSTQEQIAVDFGRDVHIDAMAISFACKNLTMQTTNAACVDLRRADGAHNYQEWYTFRINGKSITAADNEDGLAVLTVTNVTFCQLVVYWMRSSYSLLGDDAELSEFMVNLGSTPTAYAPYTPMGGGTATPTEPLYGLPDAMDTVEVSTDGDVTVTRRTGYIASYSDESLPGGWISSHDVYAAGTTPTTGAQVVYELAEPTTKTLSPVAPIAPQPGVVNIFTDADTLSATITGSGWDTIGDMGGLEAQLAEKVDAADLATVATSGSYNDLTDKPNIAEEIDVDTTITEGGTNPVTGGAIYTALAGKADASHTQSANTITAGVLAGQVQANATAAAALDTAQVRSIRAGAADLTPGESALTTGEVYLVYE